MCPGCGATVRRHPAPRAGRGKVSPCPIEYVQRAGFVHTGPSRSRGRRPLAWRPGRSWQGGIYSLARACARFLVKFHIRPRTLPSPYRSWPTCAQGRQALWALLGFHWYPSVPFAHHWPRRRSVRQGDPSRGAGACRGAGVWSPPSVARPATLPARAARGVPAPPSPQVATLVMARCSGGAVPRQAVRTSWTAQNPAVCRGSPIR